MDCLGLSALISFLVFVDNSSMLRLFFSLSRQRSTIQVSLGGERPVLDVKEQSLLDFLSDGAPVFFFHRNESIPVFFFGPPFP